MYAVKTNKSVRQLLGVGALLCAALLAGNVRAAAPGIIGTGSAGQPHFALTAAPGHISQPDGNTVYSWGYGCASPPGSDRFLPANIPNAKCPDMQLPGPTLLLRGGNGSWPCRA